VIKENAWAVQYAAVKRGGAQRKPNKVLKTHECSKGTVTEPINKKTVTATRKIGEL